MVFTRQHLVYLLIFVMIELVFILYLIATNQPFTTITPDGKLYYNLAENFINGQGLINTVRQEDIIVPPLFALILVPFAYIFDTPNAFFIFQFILFGINGLILYHLTKRLFHKDLIAIIAALLYAIHPVILLNGPQYLLTETIFITIILIVMYLSLQFIDLKKSKYFVGLVTVLSISLIFRPHLLYLFPVVFLLWLFFILRKDIRTYTALVFLFPILLLMGNGIINQTLHGEFVYLENYSGQNLYIANNPNSDVTPYASTKLEEFVEPYYYTLSDLTLSERSQILKDRAVSYMLSNPLITIERMVGKILLFFKGIYIIDWVTLLLFLFGFVVAFIKERELRFILAYILFVIVGFAALTSIGLLVGGQRYRTPIIPVYLILSSYGIYSVIQFIKKLIPVDNLKT